MTMIRTMTLTTKMTCHGTSPSTNTSTNTFLLHLTAEAGDALLWQNVCNVTFVLALLLSVVLFTLSTNHRSGLAKSLPLHWPRTTTMNIRSWWTSPAPFGFSESAPCTSPLTPARTSSYPTPSFLIKRRISTWGSSPSYLPAQGRRTKSFHTHVWKQYKCDYQSFSMCQDRH